LPPAHCQKETNPVVEVLLGVHDFAAKNDPGMTIIGALAKDNTTYNDLIKLQNIAWDFL
jgi:hypothetical protein